MTDLLREALKWLDHQPHAEALTAARELRKWLAVTESPTGQLEAVGVEDDETYRVEFLIPRNAGTQAWCREYLGEALRLVAVSDD